MRPIAGFIIALGFAAVAAHPAAASLGFNPLTSDAPGGALLAQSQPPAVPVQPVSPASPTPPGTPIPNLPWLNQGTQPAPPPSSTTVQPVQPPPGAPPPPSSSTVQPVPPPPGPPPPGSPPALPPPGAAALRGPAQVLDTANLVVAGRTIALFGIVGAQAPYDGELAAYIRAQGGAVDCVPRDAKYVCTTTSGYDVAAAALLNGAARAAPDAPPDYLREQETARQGQRGIWARAKKKKRGIGI